MTGKCTEVRNSPVEARQAKPAFYHSSGLPQRQAKETFDSETELNGGIGESWLTPPLACSRRQPVHVFVEPEEWLSSLPEGLVVVTPVDGLILGKKGLAHAVILPGVSKSRLMQQSLSEVIEYEHIVSCFPRLYEGVAADMAGADSDQNYAEFLNLSFCYVDRVASHRRVPIGCPATGRRSHQAR